MKKSVIITALSLGLFAAPFAHASKRSELAYIESYRGRTDIPVPLSVVSPDVGRDHAGLVVELVFVVDPTGQPVQIGARTPVDHALEVTLANAVAKWKFAPARDAEGRPIAKRVVLPLRITDTDATGTEVAAQ